MVDNSVMGFMDASSTMVFKTKHFLNSMSMIPKQSKLKTEIQIVRISCFIFLTRASVSKFRGSRKFFSTVVRRDRMNQTTEVESPND